jgi:hypothetical protein
MSRHLVSLAVAGTLASALSAPGPVPALRAADSSCVIEGVERIVAVGDVHGAYDQFVAILKKTGVIDANLTWSGGRTHLVQTGDVLDRGADSLKALDLLRRLQSEAFAAGGVVHPLLGNHETMRMLGDLRYVNPGEYEAFVTPQSEELRRLALERFEESRRAELLKETPLGMLEMWSAFAAEGEYGKWLRTLNVVVKINGVLFLHGGISPALADMPCDAVNAAVRRELTSDLEQTRRALPQSLIGREDGPVWYRGLATEPEDTFGPQVDDILARQGARAAVVGHSVARDGWIHTRFGGKVLQIDTGMQPDYVRTGRPSALEIAGGVFTAIYEDEREPIGEVPAPAVLASQPSR